MNKCKLFIFSDVLIAVRAGDLGAIADFFDYIFIIPGLGCVNQFLVELLLLPLVVIGMGQ